MPNYNYYPQMGGNPYGANPYGSYVPMQSYQQPTQSGLFGKIVDSEDVAKSQEIPIGGYGIFPQGDMQKIYIKKWNNDGTTVMLTYLPVIEEKPQATEDVYADALSNIQNSIKDLSKKIDGIKTSSPSVSMTRVKKKEAE